jgi:hypothetical protein
MNNRDLDATTIITYFGRIIEDREGTDADIAPGIVNVRNRQPFVNTSFMAKSN